MLHCDWVSCSEVIYYLSIAIGAMYHSVLHSVLHTVLHSVLLFHSHCHVCDELACDDWLEAAMNGSSD